MSARINRPIEEVFSYVSDPLNLPRWTSAVRTVRKTADGGERAASTYVMERDLPSGRAVNQLDVLASEPPSEFVLRASAGPTPFVYRYRFCAESDETIVKLWAEVELPGTGGPLRHLARRAVRRGVDDNFAALKRLLEARASATLT